MFGKNIKIIVKTAVFAAIICVCTMLIPVPLPGGGYANLGDALVIAAGFFCGPVYGALAAAIGSALADVLLGSALYAPATFLIKGAMALTVALVCRSKKITNKAVLIIFASLLSEIEMVVGYFVYEVIIYDFSIALMDIAGNAVQGICGVVFSAVIVNLLNSAKSIRKILKI